MTAKARVKAFCFAPPAARLPAGVRCRLALSLGNNSIEVRRGVTREARGNRVRRQGVTQTGVVALGKRLYGTRHASGAARTVA